MNFTGKLDNLMMDISTGKQKVVFTINEDIRQSYDRLNDCELLNVEIKKHRKKRSLDANAYYWKLASKVAEALHVSKPYIHNYLLRKYGQIEIIDGQGMYTVLPDTESAQKTIDESQVYHLKPTSQVKEGRDGVMYRTYMTLKGSSYYDTKEMSDLIDGLVGECKQMGIETLPPDELERMMAAYGKRRSEKE